MHLRNRIRPGPFAGRGASRGATCFYPYRSFGAPPPFSVKIGEAGWGSQFRYNGQFPSLLQQLSFLRGQCGEVDFIIELAISHYVMAL